MQVSSFIYGNCCVLSPDGILMFRCTEKKINWYLSRDLADLVYSDPKTIKLKFKPNGLGNHNKPYGLMEMQNKCVNCGKDHSLTKHHVIPISYRKHFPLEIKSHNFHDVLPMCIECHEKYERKADILKKEISEKYNVPLSGTTDVKLESLNKYNRMAKALLNNNIPKNKKRHFRSSIKKFFDIKRLSKKRVKEISEIKHNKRTHGELVMAQITDIRSFIELWRKHFIENNECNFIPKNWNITNHLK